MLPVTGGLRGSGLIHVIAPLLPVPLTVPWKVSVIGAIFGVRNGVAGSQEPAAPPPSLLSPFLSLYLVRPSGRYAGRARRGADVTSWRFFR